MTSKICDYCKKEFTLKSKFHPKQRYCSKFCRDKNNYLENKEIQIERAKQFKINNPQKHRAYNKKWSKTKNGKISNLKRNIDYIKNNPLKRKAHELLNKDKKKNPHLYPKECCICGVKKNIEFHHPNYDFPYSVYPLCKTHHTQIHNNLKEAI